MRMALITAIFGDYDVPKPLNYGHGFDDAILVTDNPTLEAHGWRIHLNAKGWSPRMSAKYPKISPFDYVGADAYVWIDAAFTVINPEFRVFCEQALEGNDIVVWEHPHRWHRNCLYPEAELSLTLPKYAGSKIQAQVDHYRAEGMPADFGLWACGSIVWRNCPEAKAFSKAWLAEIRRWSVQDQISFPYLVWKMSPKLGVFPANEMENPYLRWSHHTDGT